MNELIIPVQLYAEAFKSILSGQTTFNVTLTTADMGIYKMSSLLITLQ